MHIALAVSNEHGTEPLIIRQGQVMATVRRVPESSIRHSKSMQWTPTPDKQHQAAASVQSQPESAERVQAEVKRIAEKDVIWSLIHDKSGKDIVKAVKAGQQIGEISFAQWKATVTDELKFGPRITVKLQEDLTCLLYALRLVVAKDPKKPGVMKGFEGTITLVDPATEPIKSKHRRYTPKECEIIKKEVLELYANGMIEQSDSPWSAPVVLVKKKDGKWRFCVNYTATVNRFLRHDAQPLANAQDVLDNLAKATTLSLWDVCSGYWHIKLREQDRKFTAFTANGSLWQWTRLPFGLATSGSQFVRSIESVLREDHPDSIPSGINPDTGHKYKPEPILSNTVEMFVDDGTIHTTDEQDHINEVARCLKQLMIHDITIKMAKCIWGTDEADLIGHIVKCGEGIRPDTKKINDLLAMDYLHTIGDLKAFLWS